LSLVYICSASVELQCTPNSKESVLYGGSNTKFGDVKLTLFSKASCIGQVIEIETHGFFYTFFLIIFIILFSYLVVGILYNYFFVGARGYELLPNYDFWSRLWLSIRLGFLYVKNGCRVVPTEDSYDAI
jgi:cation-dependent mannose-6-phosphate receptor